jgi:hypothetical protein
VTIPTEVNEERRRRLANQHLFRHCYVNCSCETGCHICAYTGLVTKGHAKHASPTTGKRTKSVRRGRPGDMTHSRSNTTGLSRSTPG